MCYGFKYDVGYLSPLLPPVIYSLRILLFLSYHILLFMAVDRNLLDDFHSPIFYSFVLPSSSSLILFSFLPCNAIVNTVVSHSHLIYNLIFSSLPLLFYFSFCVVTVTNYEHYFSSSYFFFLFINISLLLYDYDSNRNLFFLLVSFSAWR